MTGHQSFPVPPYLPLLPSLLLSHSLSLFISRTHSLSHPFVPFITPSFFSPCPFPFFPPSFLSLPSCGILCCNRNGCHCLTIIAPILRDERKTHRSVKLWTLFFPSVFNEEYLVYILSYFSHAHVRSCDTILLLLTLSYSNYMIYQHLICRWEFNFQRIAPPPRSFLSLKLKSKEKI